MHATLMTLKFSSFELLCIMQLRNLDTHQTNLKFQIEPKKTKHFVFSSHSVNGEVLVLEEPYFGQQDYKPTGWETFLLFLVL